MICNRCAVDFVEFHECAVPVSMESISDAIDWLLSQPMQTEVSSTSTIESLLAAQDDEKVSSRIQPRVIYKEI